MHVRGAFTASERRQQRCTYPSTNGYLSHAYPTSKPLLMPVRSTLITSTNTYLPPAYPRYRHLLTRLEGHAYSAYKPFLMHVRSALTTSERRQQRRAYHVNKHLLTVAYRALTSLQTLTYCTLTASEGCAYLAYKPLLMPVRRVRKASTKVRLPAYKHLLIVRLPG